MRSTSTTEMRGLASMSTRAWLDLGLKVAGSPSAMPSPPVHVFGLSGRGTLGLRTPRTGGVSVNEPLLEAHLRAIKVAAFLPSLVNLGPLAVRRSVAPVIAERRQQEVSENYAGNKDIAPAQVPVMSCSPFHTLMLFPCSLARLGSGSSFVHVTSAD